MKNNYYQDRDRILHLNVRLTEKQKEIEIKNNQLEAYSTNLENEVRQKTEQLEFLNADLREQNLYHEQFTYILAHNMRSPITQLKGLFSVLPDDLAKDKITEETLDRMLSSINKLESVINDLSKVINVKRNAQEIFESVSLKTQLSLALTTLEEPITQSSAVIDFHEVDDDFIYGINAYIQSIFYNLIHNAIKYASEDRKPHIRISTDRFENNVVIKVQDNGIGIDLKKTNGRIFQLYQRFNSDRPGKGFGLFLIKTQVNMMKGEIQVESDLDQGTTFTISIPAAKTEHSALLANNLN